MIQTRPSLRLLLPLLMPLLHACDGAPPTGQVVASIGDEDVTKRDLRAQQQGDRTSPADLLQQVVDRKLLAQIARAQGVELDPTYLAEYRAAREELLVDALERRIGQGLRQPTEPELMSLAHERPWAFQDRAVLKLLPAGASGDGQAFLLDTASLGPDSPPVPAGGDGQAITIAGRHYAMLERRPTPVPVALYLDDARQLWQREMIRTELRRLLEAKQATTRIRYQEGYGPGLNPVSIGQ